MYGTLARRTSACPFGIMGDSFRALDYLRRRQRRLLDALGYSPVQTPSRIVFSGPGAILRAYQEVARPGPALLIVPAPIKRHYICDLAPQASVVGRCLRGGLRVYLVEWTVPGSREEGFGLPEYADRLLLACLDAIEGETGEPHALIAGHSLGGTLAAIFAALHPRRVRGLVLLEAPLNFGPHVGPLDAFASIAPDAGTIRARFGNIPGSYLDLAAVTASPSSFAWDRWRDGIASWPDAPAMATHARVERWALDERAMAGQLFEDVLERLYRRNSFMRGSLVVNRRRAGPESMAAPLLSIVNPDSPLIPPESILPFHDAARTAEKRLLYYTGDRGVALQHVGTLVGRNAHRHLWPVILRWMRSRRADGETWRDVRRFTPRPISAAENRG